MSDHDDEFFVGYQPTPRALGRTLVTISVVLAVIAGISAALVASAQRDPGAGKWDLSNPTETTGVLFERPYPMLRSSEATMLLIDEGKVGAADRVKGLHGSAVAIRASRIERDGFAVLELSGGDGAIREINGLREPDPPIVIDASVTMRGEIIDPKCHSGTMKPGDGKAHKACATLCIRGGIPPVFLASNGQRYLLIDEAAQPLREDRLDEVLPFVADDAEIRGVTAQQGGVTLLMIPRGAVRRWK